MTAKKRIMKKRSKELPINSNALNKSIKSNHSAKSCTSRATLPVKKLVCAHTASRHACVTYIPLAYLRPIANNEQVFAHLRFRTFYLEGNVHFM